MKYSGFFFYILVTGVDPVSYRVSAVLSGHLHEIIRTFTPVFNFKCVLFVESEYKKNGWTLVSATGGCRFARKPWS